MEGNILNILDPEEIVALQSQLLDWFEKEKRDFPWRHTSDPYFILIAEKLLQQTVARQTVVKAYEEILKLYPVPEQLAAAQLETLQTIIAPLGFHYRAAELITLGRALVERHNGTIPNNLKELKALPGVGDYAARAILSFAYKQDVPIVDVNVARFLYRIFGLTDPFPANPARKKSLIDLAKLLLPPGRSRDFNLAILDLCAMVCVSNNPKCSICPVNRFCYVGQH
jgi:A/G-specific adenine glycosylase